MHVLMTVAASESHRLWLRLSSPIWLLPAESFQAYQTANATDKNRHSHSSFASNATTPHTKPSPASAAERAHRHARLGATCVSQTQLTSRRRSYLISAFKDVDLHAFSVITADRRYTRSPIMESAAACSGFTITSETVQAAGSFF